MMKQHVCPVDKRRFATRAALNQHRLDSHGSGQKPTPGPSNSSRASPRTVGISQSSLVRGVGSDLAILNGTDRVAELVLTPSTIRPQTILVDKLVVPSMFGRLALVSRAFQKIKYRSLRFVVQPQVSSLTGGGYVAAFVKDPADTIGSIAALTSQVGSVTTKWWQSANVEASLLSKELFTSEGTEVREFSPGRFVLMSDGAPTQTGNVTVFAQWSVQLSQASLENPKQMPNIKTVLVDVYTRHNQYGLWRWTGRGIPDQDASTWDYSPSSMLGAEAVDGQFYRLETPLPFRASSGSMRIANWLWINGGRLYPCYSTKTDSDLSTFQQIDLVIRKDTVVSLEQASTGEVSGPSSSDALTTMACDQTSQGLDETFKSFQNQLSQVLKTLSELSKGSCQQCPSPPEVLDCEENS